MTYTYIYSLFICSFLYLREFIECLLGSRYHLRL
jgi:hypothetical protein